MSRMNLKHVGSRLCPRLFLHPFYIGKHVWRNCSFKQNILGLVKEHVAIFSYEFRLAVVL